MLEYIRSGWGEGGEAHEVVKTLVKEVISLWRIMHRLHSLTFHFPYLLQTIELFGVEKCMFASNFPVDKIVANTSLEALITSHHGLVADLSEDDRRALFRDTALRVYKLA